MLKVGLIGLGHLGKIHLSQLSQIPDIQVIGVFDTDTAKALQVIGDSGIPVYDDPGTLISDAQALDIVSPTGSHYGYATACLDSGKAAFIEKPLAGTVQEAHEIAERARETGIVVQVGHVERFNPAFMAARPYFSKPLFIEAHRLAQFNPRGTDVSVIFDLMIHDLDVMLSLNESEVTGIHASGVSIVSDTPDIANARVEFADGCVANLTASRMSMKNMRKSRFFQADAYISVDFLERKTEVIRMNKLEGEPDPLAIVVDAGSKGQKVIRFENPEIREHNAIREELKAFAASVLKGTPVAIPASDGSRAVELAHAISEKMKTAASPVL